MIKNILTKKPFVRITAEGHLRGKIVSNLRNCTPPHEIKYWQLVAQSDFLREYYPTGHKINSKEFYPDKVKYDEKQQRFFEEKVFRASFPLQMVITAQQLVHTCGNDIHHELTRGDVDESMNTLFLEFQEGWLKKHMEVEVYDFIKSAKITGDAAMVFYLLDGKMHTKVLSFLNGDTLYPHYNNITGELDAFARTYYDYDEKGNEYIKWVEVWDNEYMYRYRQDQQGIKSKIAQLKEYFGLDGYALAEEPKKHGFNQTPVSYHRDDNGACWSFSQDNIDKYELAISHLCQNNMAYAFPIMILKGEDVEIKGDMYGAVKAITMGQDDSASFMNHPEATQAFELQIQTLLKMIFMGSFTVMPPEVKSGDLPGVAIKLIYSPSLEKAMLDAKEYDKAIDKIQKLFLYGYGVEQAKLTQYMNLSIFSWIEPYVHQNAAELINNLVQACNTGILSKQTGSELTGYDKNNEFDRIMREKKMEQECDLLYQIEQQKQNIDNNAE